MYQPKQSATNTPASRGGRIELCVFASLTAVAVLFFAKPLFNSSYTFPWDFRYVQVPLITLLADQLRAGSLPLWDPYTYAGNPIYANIQACFFHPLIFAAALASRSLGPDSLPLSIEWMVVVQVALAGYATYILTRDLGASRAGAWTAGVICECGPYFASRTEHIGAMMAAAWMPLAWLAVWRLNGPRPGRWLAILAASLGMSVLGGSPAATIAVFASSLLLAMLAACLRQMRYRAIGLTAIGCALGIALSAMEFLPAAELTENSVAKYRLDYLGTGGGMKFASLLSLFAPDHYHLFHLKDFKGPGDPTFLYLYCSLFGLLLAVTAIVRRRDRTVAVFAFIAALGCFWMLGDSTALWRVLYPYVPARIRIAIHPEFTYCIFAECIAILAGLGLACLPGKRILHWAAAFVIAGDLYFTGSGRPMNCSSLREEPGITRDSIDGNSQLTSRVRRLSNASFPPARIDTAGASIDWAECAPLTLVPTGSGASPVAPERMIQVRLAQTEPALPHGGRAGTFYPADRLDSPALDLLSEKFLLAGTDAARAKAQASSKWIRLADLPGNTVFQNVQALPRAFLVSDFKRADYAGAIAFIRQPEVDFLNSAAVENSPDQRLDASPQPGSAQIVSYRNDELVVRTNAPGRRLLVVTEAWYPGWKAYIDGRDGREATIYPADVAFRGVFLPPGQHRVRMVFRPKIFSSSLAISAATACLLLMLALVSGRRITPTPSLPRSS